MSIDEGKLREALQKVFDQFDEGRRGSLFGWIKRSTKNLFG